MAYASPISPVAKSIYLIDSDGYYSATNLEDLAKETYEALTTNSPSWALSIGSLDVNAGGITNAGAISGATDITLSGVLQFAAMQIRSGADYIHIFPTIGNEVGKLCIMPSGTEDEAHLRVRNDISSNWGAVFLSIDGTIASISSDQSGTGTAPTTLNINDADWATINIGDAGATVNITGIAIANGVITGVNSIACDLGTSINEFSIDGTLVGNSDDAVPTEKAVKTYVDGVAGGAALFAFKTITGITNDVVADQIADSLILASANNRLTIVGTTATDTITFTLVEGNIDHDALANYDANKHIDHTAVTLTAGSGLSGGGTIAASRTFDLGALTGDWDAGSFKITAEQLESDVAAGTPPLVVASTDVVANLNVDMVDGYHLDQAVLIASTPTFAGLTINGAMVLNGAITGVNSIACDLGTSINEFSTDDTLAGDSDDAVPTEQAVKAYVDGAVGGASLYAFKTITGITNDVVADAIADTLTLASANNLLTIVGVSATDTITWTIVEGNFVLDGNTVQIDEINSDGGAFAFNTTGPVTFNQDIITTGDLIDINVVTGALLRLASYASIGCAFSSADAFFGHNAEVHQTINQDPIVMVTHAALGARGIRMKTTGFEFLAQSGAVVAGNALSTIVAVLNDSGDFQMDGDLTVSGGQMVIASSTETSLLSVWNTLNNGNPVFSIGKDATDRFLIQTVYNAGTQEVDYVQFYSTSTGAAGNDGRFLFYPDGQLAFAIDVDKTVYFYGVAAGITNLFMTGELDMTGALACIDLNPAGTGSKTIIDLVPTANLVAGSAWYGLGINVDNLDPATGAASTIIGVLVYAANLVSVDNNASLYGFQFNPSATESSFALVAHPREMTTNKQFMIMYSYSTVVLSATATYRGWHQDWSAVTRDGGAPVLRGINVWLPADYTGFGTSYAAYFTGDGRSVKICDTTYALDISGAMRLDGAITGINSIACDLGTSINEFSTDTTLAGNSDDAVPTEKAIKAYVATQVATVNSLAEILVLGNEADGTDLILDEGADLIVYSDDKVSEVARIDGATGNITTIGTVDGVDVSAIVAFKTITGITNDVVADSLTDSLTLATANNLLTIVGTTATDTITFTIVEANISHDAIADVSADDHHAQSHALTTHSDVVLADPGADQMVFWDDSDSKFEFLIANTGLSIIDNNLNCDITQYTDGLARTACLEDDVYGAGWNGDVTHAPTQNAVYDKIAAMDILIAANTTVVEVEAVITAELVNGQSIDNAIDALINTHNVANRHIDHSAVTITAGVGLSGGGTIAASRTIDCDITQYTDGLAKAACVSDVVYGAGWNGVTDVAASKNAVYDQLVTHYADVDAHHAQVHTHDGDTLQLDGINSDGGAFSFLTTGPISFNNALDGITTISAGGTYFQVDASGNVLLSVIIADASNPFRDSPTIELKAKYWTGAATADVAMLLGNDVTGGAPRYKFFIKREDLTNVFSVDESGHGMVLGNFTAANIVTAGNVDGVDISATLDQAVLIASRPTFAGLNLTPSSTGTQDVINITPSAALVQGSAWVGTDMNLNALDPATGNPSSIVGLRVNATNLVSVDNDAAVYGFYFLPPPTESSYMLYHLLTELTVSTTQRVLYSYSTAVLSFDATYQGVYLDWDGITRNAGIPGLQGIRVHLPGNYTGFGTCYAGYFSGDGRRVYICDTTHALDVLGDVRISSGWVKNPADNEGFYTGIGDDLRIYHSGTHSYITNITGTLYLDCVGNNVSMNTQIFYMDISDNFRIRDRDDGDAVVFNLDVDTRTLAIGSTTDTMVTSMYGGALPLYLKRNSSTVGAAVGITFSLYSDASAYVDYAKIAGEVRVNTAGSEDGRLDFFVISGGAMTNRMTLDKDGDLQIDGDLIVSGGMVTCTPPSGTSALVVEAGDLDVNVWEIIRAGAHEYGYYMKYIGTGSSDANYLELWSHNTTGADELLMRWHQQTQETEIAGLLSLVNELDMTGALACIDLNPASTGSKQIINITPTATLVAGSTWSGLYQDLTNLDPLTGAACTIHGVYVNAAGLQSADGDAVVYAFRGRAPPADNSYMFVHLLTELTANKEQRTLFSYFSGALSATATYQGVYIDWDAITRDGGAPVLQGVRVNLPGNYANFGACYAGYFSGDGRYVYLCTTDYALNVSGAMILNGNITQVNSITLDIGTNITEFSTDGTLAGNSNNALPTEQAVKTYADAVAGGAHALATHTDVTMTGAELDDLTSFGAANAAWMNCPLEHWSDFANFIMAENGTLENVGLSESYIFYSVPLSTNRGGKKLYLSGRRLGLQDADASNRIRYVYVYGYQNDGTIDLLDTYDTDDMNTPGEHEDLFGAVDCSGYSAIKVRLRSSVLNATQLNIGYITVRYYYA